MRRVRRLTTTGLATLGVLAGGLVLASAPALAAAPEKPVKVEFENVTATTATLKGELNPLAAGETGTYEFLYKASEVSAPATVECEEGHAPEPAGAALGNKEEAVSADLTNLQPNAKYTFCLRVRNEAGGEATGVPLTSGGQPITFNTLPAPPKIEGESTSVTSAGIRLEAQINPNNQETTYVFEYAPEGTEGTAGTLAGPITKVAGAKSLSNFGDQGASATPGAVLAPDTSYYYRVVAENGQSQAEGIPVVGEVLKFTTPPAPLVSTGEAQNITGTAATLAGTVNPEGAETTYYFVYITEAGFQEALKKGAANPYTEGETTAPLSAGSGTEPQAILPTPISGLQPGQTYHYALVAKSAIGLTIGPDETFATPAGTPPMVSTGGASGVSQNAATVSGTVTTNGLQTNYGFEIATEPFQPSTHVPATGLGAIGGAAVEGVALTLGRLQPGTTYYYRVTATNADGTSQGAPASFTTPGFPALLTVPASPPLIATPSIAFPKEEKESATTTKTLTRAQKLAAALKACKKQHGKQKQAKCERQARAKYGPAKKTAKKGK